MLEKLIAKIGVGGINARFNSAGRLLFDNNVNGGIDLGSSYGTILPGAGGTLALTSCAGTAERHGQNMRAKNSEPWREVIYEKKNHESNPKVSTLVIKSAPGASNEIGFYYPQGEQGPTEAEKAAIIYEHYQRKVVDPDEASKLRWAGLGPAADAATTMFCLGKGGFAESNKLLGAAPSAGALAAGVIIPYVMFQYLPSKNTPVWQSWGAGRKIVKNAGKYRAGVAAKNLITCT